MNNFNYLRASDVQDAISQSAREADVKYLAGGTNLIDLMKYNLTRADILVDINRISDHREITELPDGGLRLGAFVKNAATAWNHLVEEHYPLLSKAILAGASAQIRNMATNGGNLLQRTRCYYFYDANVPCNKREPGSGCSAITGYQRIMAILGTTEHCIAVFPSDMCVALAALDAVVQVEGPQGMRSIHFADFHRLPGDTPHIDNNLKPGEIITGIDLPAKGFSKNYSYLKLRDRNSYAFALVSVATGLELDGETITDARIALGGVAHKPWRVAAAEDFLKGKTASGENFRQAAEIIVQGAVGYEHNAFKIELAKRAIVRNCMMALHPESQLPGAQPSA
ncbi:xanthine dehydrogenase family protein subunit M [Dyadobacter sp. CY323]|uniref:FAD binding domain-containing protein n=1 Tax=Dyadobacter sp. CY323 TaxID=2907302 RepID=UPI001F2E8719|nr:xanthine dehydrogenase family protein subunit M [Dyadobacter sp. CY323]MCE6990141.1 xanthine dehydrogenase family protein subunit M [Dyadobacter sp. CY323]